MRLHWTGIFLPQFVIDRIRIILQIHHNLMKLNSRTRGTFFILLLLGFITGTLGWEVLERILAQGGVLLNLSAGPIGFDLFAVSFYIRFNPGSLVGIIITGFLFRSL